MDILHFLFGVFGNAIALSLFLAPMYGLPFVSESNILILTICATGTAIESIHVVIFIIYAPKKEKAKILLLFTFALVVFSFFALVSLFAIHSRTRRLFCVSCAVISTIVMLASPLLIMKHVI